MTSETPRPSRAGPLDDLLGYLLHRLSSVMMTNLSASLAPARLRPVEAMILILVKAHSGCTQSDIGRTLDIARANMAPLIAGLMKEGWIAKSPVDGRSHALSLTPEGEIKLREAQAIIKTHEDRFQAPLDDVERERLLASLRHLLAAGPARPSA